MDCLPPPLPPPPQAPPPQAQSPKKKRKKKKKKKKATKKKGVGAKASILLSALHPQAIVDVKHPKGSRKNNERLLNCVMMEQVERKIKGVTKPCVLVKHEEYGNDLLYCAEQYAVCTSEGPEDDYFPEQAPKPADLPIWNRDDDDNNDEDETNDDIIHNSQNNAEDIAQVRDAGFLVDNDNDPAPENIPALDTGEEAQKENVLPLDQEWGWDNTYNRQKKCHHHSDVKINDHSKQDLIDLEFLEVFWLMFLLSCFQLSVVRFTSRTLQAKGHDKTSLGEPTRFLGCIFFMACTSGFGKQAFWSSKPVSMMKGAVSLQFYSSSSFNFLANQFHFHPLTTTCSHGG